jgi:hypothetical protein
MALQVAHPLHEVMVTTTALSVATGIAGVIRAPFQGKVVNVGTVIGSVVSTADATCTTSIAGTAITGGSFVITQSGSAIGDLDSSVPTAANTCNEDDVIKFAFTGSGTAGGHVQCFAVIRRGTA